MSRVLRGTNVKNAGGVGMVLVSAVGYKNSAVSDGHVIPTVHVGEWDGASLRQWLTGAANAQVTLRGTSSSRPIPAWLIGRLASARAVPT